MGPLCDLSKMRGEAFVFINLIISASSIFDIFKGTSRADGSPKLDITLESLAQRIADEDDLIVSKFPVETHLSFSDITNEVGLSVGLSICQNLFGVLIPPRNIDEVEFLKSQGFNKVWVDLKKISGTENYISPSGHFLASNVPGAGDDGLAQVTGPSKFPSNK